MILIKNPAMALAKWPWWIKLWLFVSSLVVLWDASFVLLRPRSMEGGDLFWIWTPYKTYCSIDKLYCDLQDNWVVAQSYANLVESALNFFALFLYFTGSVRLASVIANNSCLMTFWKTILYFTVEAHSGFIHTIHNEFFDVLTMYYIPSGFWVFVPLFIVIYFGRRLSEKEGIPTRTSIPSKTPPNANANKKRK